MRVAVLMGGMSAEREVSLNSGNSVLKALVDLGYDAYPLVLDEKNMGTALVENNFDIAYIALHGEFGEDGRVQGMLDILGKKYTGSSYRASCLTMDKVVTKKLLGDKGILMAKTYTNIGEVDSFPVVVKPAREGSSVGLYICNNKEELVENFEKIKDKDPIIEEFIMGEELTAGVLNGESLGVVKIKPKSGLYDYESKYTKGASEYECPANIDNDLYEEAMRIAKIVHTIFGLEGASRSDFILKEGRLYFLEVNTSPGMTETSLLPKLASLKGYNFKDLVKNITDFVEK